MSVICINTNTCEFRHECGGAKQHDRCNECGKYPFNKNSTCIEFINPTDIRIDTITTDNQIEMTIIHLPTGAWVKDKHTSHIHLKNNLLTKLSIIVEKLE